MDDNAEAANKVLSGKFAYVTDNNSVDKLAASSPGALGKENITIAAPGFSLAGYAVKKGWSANCRGSTDPFTAVAKMKAKTANLVNLTHFA